MSRKEKFEKIETPPKREPFVQINGRGRYGYRVSVVEPAKSSFYYYEVTAKVFLWGQERAEAWGKRQLAKYLKRRAHEDYERVIY